MSRLRRPYLCDHYFFVTCRLARGRNWLNETDFQLLAELAHSARQQQGFFLTAWVFLPDHWHAIMYPRYPLTISTVMKSIKIKSTRSINARLAEESELWQARFYDHALRTVGDYHDCVDYIHQNPVRRGARRDALPLEMVECSCPLRPAGKCATDRPNQSAAGPELSALAAHLWFAGKRFS